MFPRQSSGHLIEFTDRFSHMNGNSYGPRFLCDGACDGLPDPPVGVCGKAVAASMVKSVHGFHQPHVSLLNQVDEGNAFVLKFLGDTDHETQIGAYKIITGP